jgi:hypothetical protein
LDKGPACTTHGRSAIQEGFVTRYRLRFLLQEFDLPRGVTVIGRSLDCNLTLEDPLVSRQHARIVVDDSGGTVHDMDSRNGVRVNGTLIRAATTLTDGDRVRIGTQEFVFCRVDEEGRRHSKTTGVLRLCKQCRLPYPREMVACPNCEGTEQTDEETLSGSFGAEDRSAWNVQLLVEALERALTLGRTVDAERLVRRATVQVEELVAAGESFDAAVLTRVALPAVATTLITNDPTWVLWAIDVHRRARRVPALEVARRIGEAASHHRHVVRGALESLLEHLGSAGHTSASADAEARQGADANADEALAHLQRTHAALTDDDVRPGPKLPADETAQHAAQDAAQDTEQWGTS